MSSQGQYGSGAHDAPQGPPNVYHPNAAPAPAYDQYADPAYAHGWQPDYDETAPLPQVPGDFPGADHGHGGGTEWQDATGTAPAAVWTHPGADGHDPGCTGPGAEEQYAGWAAPAADVPDTDPRSGPAGTRAGVRAAARRAERKRGSRRRAVIAVGAVTAVSAAALLAAFSFSGSPSDGTESRQEPAPTAPDGSPGGTDETTPSATAEPTDTDPQAPAPATTSTPPTASPTSTTPEATPSKGVTTPPVQSPTATPPPTPTSTPPTPTASPSTTPTGKPGHGPGGPKRPR